MSVIKRVYWDFGIHFRSENHSHIKGSAGLVMIIAINGLVKAFFIH